jgi:hypothetical protein
VNYVLATTIAAWISVLVARAVVRPSRPLLVAVAGLGLACSFAHVLGMIVACLVASTLALELAWRTTRGRRASGPHAIHVVRRAAAAAWPLLLGCFYCIAVYRRQYAWDPRLYRDPVLEGIGPPIWRKVLWFGTYALGLYRDRTDQVVLWVAIAVIFAAVWTRWRRRRAGGPGDDSPPFVAPFFVMGLAYLATPTVLVGTHLIFQRFGQWVVLGSLLAMPAFPQAVARRAHSCMLGLAFVSGINVMIHCISYASETNDASRVLDELPEGGSATAVIWDPGTRAFRNATLTHLAAYYAARKHGQWAFAFARYLSVPVRFRPGAQPAWPAAGWEFKGGAYDPRCKYARAFPLVLVKAPRGLPEDVSGEAPLRKLVFRQDSNAVKLLAHHGRYWAFDTTGLPDDGAS